MKNERILVADDQTIVQDGVERGIKFFGQEDGHNIVGKASSVSEVEGLLKGGLRPTIALVDGKFPLQGDGDKAAAVIRRLSPETKIIAFSTEKQNYGDEQWSKDMSMHDLVKKLTNSQH